MNCNDTFKRKKKIDALNGTDILEIDNDKLVLLKQLIDDTGAKIVLSSCWREGWILRDLGSNEGWVDLFNRLEQKFKLFGIEFYDKTKILRIERGKEIMSWLANCQESIESFVAFDDIDYDMGAVGDNFICTSMKTGLLPCHTERARQILNSGN